MSEDIINAFITGSTFVSSTASTLLNPNAGYNIRLDSLCDKILLEIKKEGSIDIPTIMEKFQVSADMAFKAINRLKDSGRIQQNRNNV